MPNVVVYSKDDCPYCEAAKRLLEGKGVTFKEINVSKDPKLLDAVIQKTGHRTVPQIFINDQFVGGHQELDRLDGSGELDRLLGIK
jgi:glutaredoxin 3